MKALLSDPRYLLGVISYAALFLAGFAIVIWVSR